MTDTELERFCQKFRVDDDGCWVWVGQLTTNGYAKIRPEGGRLNHQRGHLWAYRHWKGEVPEGLELDHLCHTRDLGCAGGKCKHRRCVNPDHLEPVTHRENVIRGWSRRRRPMQFVLC